jgi:hypothetical protein
MADTRDAHGRCWLNTTVSGGLRVATAARSAGIDLQGTTLMVAGEPATPAKVRGITASGAAMFMDYGMGEAGRLAMGCAATDDATDVHLLTDAYAIIPWPRTVRHTGERVSSFHVTGWHPSAPKLLLNVEFDDYGVIEERQCGCPLGELGLHVHLRNIRSYGKLTGEGVTLVGSEMVRILEEVLPSRFGGSPLDYQLTEEEDGSGFTRLWLLVSPDVALPDEEEARTVILDALSHSSAAADVAGAFWRQASTLGIRRCPAYTNARGKQPSIHSPTRLTGA